MVYSDSITDSMILEGGGFDLLKTFGKRLNFQTHLTTATLLVALFVAVMGFILAGLYMKQYKSCTASTDKNAKKWYTFVVILFVLFCLTGVGSIVGLGYNRAQTNKFNISSQLSKLGSLIPSSVKSLTASKAIKKTGASYEDMSRQDVKFE